MMCKITAHTWQSTPRASSPSVMLPGVTLPAVCTACGTRYPCRHACDHIDCAMERGDELPSWVSAVPDPRVPLSGSTSLPDEDPTVTPESPASDADAS